MHHVRALKKLTGKTEAERLMLHMRRKSLALCPYCYQLLSIYTCPRAVMVTVRGAGYTETCKSGSGGGTAGTAGESQYGAAVPTSHAAPPAWEKPIR